MGPNASDIIRSCMEGEELEDLCFNYTSLVETLSSNWCCEVLALDISSPQGPGVALHPRTDQNQSLQNSPSETAYKYLQIFIVQNFRRLSAG